MTFGELLFVEKEASERDQVMQACAAQDPKLLPKQQVQSNTASAIAKSASRYFKGEKWVEDEYSLVKP